MSNIFTLARIRKKIGTYSAILGSLAENLEVVDEERSSILRKMLLEMGSERSLAMENQHDILEESNYILALDEAMNLIEQAF